MTREDMDALRSIARERGLRLGQLLVNVALGKGGQQPADAMRYLFYAEDQDLIMDTVSMVKRWKEETKNADH